MLSGFEFTIDRTQCEILSPLSRCLDDIEYSDIKKKVKFYNYKYKIINFNKKKTIEKLNFNLF